MERFGFVVLCIVCAVVACGFVWYAVIQWPRRRVRHTRGREVERRQFWTLHDFAVLCYWMAVGAAVASVMLRMAERPALHVAPASALLAATGLVLRRLTR